MLPYPSYLRVYEPVAALRGADQDRLRDVDLRHHDSVGTLTAEQQTVLRWTVMSAPSTMSDDGRTWAYVLHRDGKAHVCPADMSLRSWLSLTSLVDDIADPSLNTLVPAASFAVGDQAFLRWRRDHPQAVAHIQQVTWGVPRTWFAMVADDERELYDADGLTSVRYRTRLVDAGRRLASAHRILSNVVDDVELLDDLIGLATWLDAFDDASWVELDYAGVARLLGSELRDDHSARDISRALRALRSSDFTTAATAYRSFERRWRAVSAYERAN